MHTNLTGIKVIKCPVEHFFQVNYDEDETDKITVPDNYILMP